MDQPAYVNVFFVLTSFVIAAVLVLFICVCKIYLHYSGRDEYTLLDDSDEYFPRDFVVDPESLTQLAERFEFVELSPEEQNSYLRAQEFAKQNPPATAHVRGRSYTLEIEEVIKECGVNAFQYDSDDSEILNARYVVADKTELIFNNNDLPYSTATAAFNYALPVKNRVYSDTVYFETKVFEFNNNTNPNAHFAIGLITKPYPTAFRLPGYNNFSIAYESTGNLKINQPFPTPLQQHQGERSEYNAQVLPPLEQSDIVGFGYVISSGTIFITRNGKKLMDIMKGVTIDMYPAVGCFLTNAKFQTNIGQLGFVWVEANVRKYGFVSRSEYKKIKGDRGLAALPNYGLVLDEGDEILAKGEELPPRYPEDELDFFGRSSQDVVRLGSSSKADQRDEEKTDDEKKTGSSSSKVTNETEEEMSLRERIYEQITHDETDVEGTPEPVDAAGNLSELIDAPANPDADASATESSKAGTPEVEQGTSTSTGPKKKGNKKKKKGKKGKKRK
ncbi:SPRY-domain-containing protein [Suhomyces tanzawaensis NRRL Y-17324]|uniref:SPRY-domain-containing protein n=1 Tax=Suhomyces tanzawaensis NRRL Y-17324 TaxID=984487 RepID=A0A1E4SFR7_9ASCO|nr:SPRY-domain-containing protein [Suhomyces tanzawaensis NRRL Y-17324]ODV78310.1 SPRY-domain-containing protein [Suhomyces tanzawaensis NRRL Y-17324]